MNHLSLRLLAALVGGYALANLLPLALTLWLPLTRISNTVTALLLSFAVYVAAILWAFAAPNGWRALAGMLWIGIPAALLIAVRELTF